MVVPRYGYRLSLIQAAPASDGNEGLHINMDINPSLPILGRTHHGGMVGALIWHPIQRLQVFHASLPDFPRRLQYYVGCGYPPLGNSSGGIGGRSIGFCVAVHILATLFYADDGLLYSPRPSSLQEALDVLTGLLYRVGLSMNVNKTVDMTYQPCRAAVRQS